MPHCMCAVMYFCRAAGISELCEREMDLIQHVNYGGLVLKAC